MKIGIRRTFHPVGQGAFCTELLASENGERFRMVYDCGTKTGKKQVNPGAIIQDALDNDEPIDILFISHFDKDHVSMIGELCKRHSIKRVVLPLLSAEDTAVLQAHYRQSKNRIGEQLLADPVAFFKGQTAVIRVEPMEQKTAELSLNDRKVVGALLDDSDILIQKPSGEHVDIKSGAISDIPSGSRLLVPHYAWCYIPHNYEYPKRHQALLAEFDKRASIERARLGEAAYIAEKSTELNQIYRALKKVKCGDINENSMLVYSGPLQCSPRKVHRWNETALHHSEIVCCQDARPACIYSVDSDFHKVKINKVYKKLWWNVGAVQIPHHGAGASFAADFLNETDYRYLCPISTNYQYGQPAACVLKDILVRNSYPLIVDARPQSKLVQNLFSG